MLTTEISNSDKDSRVRLRKINPHHSMLNGLMHVLKSLSLVCEHRYPFDPPELLF